MEKLSQSGTLSFSKELTKLAIENNLIRLGKDSKETAENVVDFYQTVLKSINEENEE